MTQNVPLDPGQRAVAPFFDHIQELLGAAAPSFYLTILTDTSIRASGGSGNDQSGIAIEGRYRWNTSNTDVTHPGGSAGARGVGAGPYEVWVTADDNSYSGTPTVDATDTSYDMVIVAAGGSVSGTRKRKVAEIDWDGSKITSLRQLAGARKGGTPLHLDAPLATFTPLRVKGATGQSAPLAEFLGPTGTSLATISSSGGLATTGGITDSSSGGLTLSGAGGKTTLEITDTGANTGLTLGGDVNLYRASANVLASDDQVNAILDMVGRASAATQVLIGAYSGNAAVVFGSAYDTALYRSGANALRTPGSLTVDADLTVTGTITNTGLATALAGKQPLDADLTALGGVTSAADKVPYFTGAGAATVTTLTAFARTLIDDADAATARDTLGLSIGDDIPANDPELVALGNLTSAADQLPYFTGSGTATLTTLTSFGRSLIDDADATAARSTLGLVIGTNVQAYDGELAALAGLASAANKLPYFTGSAAAALADFTAFGRSLVDDADATAGRATLGLVLGTDVQAFSGELAAFAGLTSAADRLPYYTGADTAALATFTSFARNLLDDADATAGRSTLGLNSMATQAASAVAITGGTMNAVAITGGSHTGMTDIAIADGGTGASDAATARGNLGAAGLGANSFTALQTITVGGAQLALIGTTTGFIEFYPQGSGAGRKGYLGFSVVSGNDFYMAAEGTNGSVLLVPSGTGQVNVSSKRISAVADATAATDAVNRQFGDTRYAQLSAANTFVGNQAITGSLTISTPLATGQGGTGSSTLSGARSNLGLAIGSDVQAYDSDLATLATFTRQNYTVTGGYTADRSFNPEATTLTEVARVLGTFIDDMIAAGLAT